MRNGICVGLELYTKIRLLKALWRYFQIEKKSERERFQVLVSDRMFPKIYNFKKEIEPR